MKETAKGNIKAIGFDAFTIFNPFSVDVLNMTGTKFGCDAGLCGACTIQIDGQPTRSCITAVSAAVGKRVTTKLPIGKQVPL